MNFFIYSRPCSKCVWQHDSDSGGAADDGGGSNKKLAVEEKCQNKRENNVHTMSKCTTDRM